MSYWPPPPTWKVYETAAAYYLRPWKDSCTFYEICLWAAERKVDPEGLMKMAAENGEWDWEGN